MPASFEVQNIVLIHIRVNILDRHLRIEELIDLRAALFVVIDRSRSQSPLPTVFQILVAALLESERYLS